MISVDALDELRARVIPPIVIDVRSAALYDKDSVVIAGAIRRSADLAAEWGPKLDPGREVVVYCSDGSAESPIVARRLKELGVAARALEGGLEAWRANGRPLRTKPPAVPTKWVTRERPKIDRIACPWLVRRFIDPDAQFFYVPAKEVFDFGKQNGATPYDIPGAEYSHDGPLCSFDAFIKRHGLEDAALDELAKIVRAADTGELDLSREAPGLLAVSLGLSRLYANDLEMLRFGMLVYDALYAWCREARGEKHFWNPEPV
jgi:rhodanese-related sulfurtransferase